jgi:hypothetical protein
MSSTFGKVTQRQTIVTVSHLYSGCVLPTIRSTTWRSTVAVACHVMSFAAKQ